MGFEEHFNEPEITDPVEKASREAALKEAEAIVKKENEKFEEGQKTWFDAINEFSDLPSDEFESEKTGDIKPPQFGRGLLEPTGSERVDAESERYFAAIRDSMKTDRASVPSSYDSKALGHVSAVKNQKQCGSCVAFSNMAAIETCFKKVSGAFGDFSEQQLIDCGFGKNGANGCDGAYTYAYVKTVADSGMGLTAEATYPYKNTAPTLTCPNNLDVYNKGAKVTGSYYSYSGDEETLKGLVAKHGAVVTSVASKGPFQEYKGGVFGGCISGQKTDHAVTVVGYGTDAATGLKYWLIKNSWGESWGEGGFIRLQRGVAMCGIGKTMVAVECEAVAGPTDATLTTEKPCEDTYSNCPDIALSSCYKDKYKTSCAKSCGLCKGMTPAASNTCYDMYTNCADLCGNDVYATTKCRKACGKCGSTSSGTGTVPATTKAPDTCVDKYGNCAELAKTACYQSHIKTGCPKSCGLCPGMTPAQSNTCYDQYTNCSELCGYPLRHQPVQEGMWQVLAIEPRLRNRIKLI